MGEGEEGIELKFRIYDGTDMGHSTYASSTTVATLKQKLVAEWPQDKTTTPKAINDVKLIHAGKILEDNRTLADSRITIGDLPAGVITMHVVVQPPATKKKTDEEHMRKMNSCSCTIL
ncbi:membrane-anchored ubiquitin-fold protein 3-like isoform X2 [Juglans microcarpa x Juglans regia]|uniref:membrane-anchored ubiquitin-fold protein 3-like isoform X2 n=1 Tax=Juglans microcarpa x Juglans regia TaxID=2249226 RepID=UPI001B7E71DF|nr:membrane-anchored ubiquitin-fold protein 3-like isoform X2 [Juglans microcarpa x Juglans regia]XP_041022246.1 membrane-anchored ubiquitin-fold protein 3-like isoform X2 [Juglans microcarpa x Juglans regia]